MAPVLDVSAKVAREAYSCTTSKERFAALAPSQSCAKTNVRGAVEGRMCSRAQAPSEEEKQPAEPSPGQEKDKQGARARDEVLAEIRASLDSNSTLQLSDFDYRIRQHLHALLGAGGRQRLREALGAIHAATMQKARRDVKNWPAYLGKLLKKNDENIASKERQARAQARIEKAAADAAPSDGGDLKKTTSPAVSEEDQWMEALRKKLSDEDSWLDDLASTDCSEKSASPRQAPEQIQEMPRETLPSLLQPRQEATVQPSMQLVKEVSAQPPQRPATLSPAHAPSKVPSRQPPTQPSTKPPTGPPTMEPLLQQPSMMPPTAPPTLPPAHAPNMAPPRQPPMQPTQPPKCPPAMERPLQQPPMMPKSAPPTAPPRQPPMQPNMKPAMDPAAGQIQQQEKRQLEMQQLLQQWEQQQQQQKPMVPATAPPTLPPAHAPKMAPPRQPPMEPPTEPPMGPPELQMADSALKPAPDFVTGEQPFRLNFPLEAWAAWLRHPPQRVASF